MFTPADVTRLVGRTTAERGEQYVRQGNVLSVARNADGTRIVAQVSGSSTKQYVASVEMSSSGENAVPRYGRCTCPVRLDCKHVAALLLAYLERHSPASQPTPVATESTRPAWEAALAPVLGDVVHPPEPDRASTSTDLRERSRSVHEIALQLELLPEALPARSYYGHSEADTLTDDDDDDDAPPRLGMRPVVRGARGRWIRSGLTWADLRFVGVYRNGEYRREHVDVLRALYGVSAGATSAALVGGYSQPPGWVYVTEIPGSVLWALLRDARRAGLPLVQSDTLQSAVELSDTLARSAVDLVRDGDDIVVRTSITLASTTLDARRTVLVGEPAAGLYTWEGSAGPILLAQLATPLGAAERDLVRHGASIRVPAQDQERFLTTVYPALRDRFDDAMVDPTIELPAPPRPSLCLTVTLEPEHAARTAWEWRYRVPDGDPDRPWAFTVPVAHGDLSAPTPRALLAHGPRDTAAEDAILERVAAVAPGVQHMLDAGPQALRGMETAQLFTDVMPALLLLADDDPDVVVDILTSTDDHAVSYHHEHDVQVSVSATPRPDSRDWFDLGVTVRAGEQTVPFAQVFTALAQGEPTLLLASGTYFTLDEDRFGRLRELIEEARALQDTMGGTLRINRFQAALFDELDRLGVVGAQAAAWRTALGALADGHGVQRLDPPTGMVATLRSYQHEGFEWLAFLYANGLGGVLADDMGLGKTLQTLALVAHVRELESVAPAAAVTPAAPDTPAAPAPFLVVAPTSVVGNWAAEARRFTPGLTVVVVSETRSRRTADLAELVAGADIVVTSYALFRLGFDEYDAVTWAGLILDEAQFVKNHQSIAYQCARRLAAPFKLAITGTPLENNLMELWSIVSVVSPGLFPHPRRFAEYYQRPIEKNGNAERLDKLRDRIRPFMLRRAKEDVAKDLPPKQEQVVDVVLNPRHRKVYDRYLQRERTNVLGLVGALEEHRFAVFRSLAVLRQASLDPALVDAEHAHIPATKLDVLFEMLDGIVAEGHSVLVFSQFTQFLKSVRDRLDARGLDHSYLDGRTRKRTETIERFTSGETKVFLISLKAGGFGLNLTAADYCFLLDPWWNPAAEAQAVDRAHRIGQERKVMVYRLVATDTIEEKVMALKATKAQLFASVLDGGAAGSGGMTADDVRELLS
ncbi:DEAD/DEAH box helicase [Sanguibacter antarcticus]|uniref:DEAD/DEAH box helicase n=1 Tax=Sanguibacter antarcticus TaxID=372484 RepID=UPI00117BBA4F|nr:DEAD/DEAH box helicase [Sanguibacter antarcticus]